MTKLTKPVFREARVDNGRIDLVVGLHPASEQRGPFFSFREKRARISVYLPVYSVFCLALDTTARAMKRERKARRRAKT